MQIHTNNPDAVADAIREAAAKLPGVYADITAHGSRSHAGAVALKLEGNGYRVNPGWAYGDRDTFGATWDEWGVVLAHLFAADADAVAGTPRAPIYDGATDFHDQTGERFASLEMPTDTHKRHTWRRGEGDPVGVWTCKRSTKSGKTCSAVKTWGDRGGFRA